MQCTAIIHQNKLLKNKIFTLDGEKTIKNIFILYALRMVTSNLVFNAAFFPTAPNSLYPAFQPNEIWFDQKQMLLHLQ